MKEKKIAYLFSAILATLVFIGFLEFVASPYFKGMFSSNLNAEAGGADYIIRELVPGEIIVIIGNKLTATGRESNRPSYQKALIDGLKDVSGKYTIKNSTGITSWIGDGSVTSSLIVFVEKKKVNP